MPVLPVEKYEIILAADPRSRIFVELARALSDRGDFARAVEVCRQGVGHHPDSIQGRVQWARALLDSGDTDGAVGQLEAAIALEPQNPLAYNLAAELLLPRALHAKALPILEKAAELQPGNEKVRARLEEARAAAGPAGATLTAAPTATAAPTPIAASTPAVAAAAAAIDALPPPRTPPPLRAEARPPPVRREGEGRRPARRGLSQIMEAAPAPAPARPEPAPAADGAEAARIAGQYETELRQKLLRDAEPPRSFARRHWLAILAVSLAVVVLGGGGLTYRLVRHRNRAEEVKRDVASARKGLARDTVGALREAGKVLEEARELDPENREALSLAAQVAALLGSDHGDEAARDLALKLAATGQAGEGGLAARYLLAATPSERTAYAEPITTAPGAAGPLVQTLAGEALLVRGDADGAARRLEAAARATPPMLRALADLGDLYRQQGRAEEALPYYRAALSAHPTHPRAAVGAAEVRLALGRELVDSLRELRAVEADPQSAPRPRDRLEFELTMAKVLAATGERAAAAERLDRVTARLGPRAEVAAAMAEIHLASGAFGDAEAEAQRAVRLAPKDVSYRILLARAEDGRGHWREMLRSTEGQQAREIRLWRGMAFYQLRDHRRAKAELERTARDGKMPAEAAAWYALAELGLGREPQARAVLERLVSLKSPPSVAFVAAGKLELAGGRTEAAERHFRSAVERDPSSLEGHCALGRLLLARGQPRDAAPFLERAARLNPFHAEARLALGNARLAAGDARGARDEYGGVLEIEPRSGDALRGLAAAWLAERKPGEARRAAERATVSDPRNPRSWLSAARAALADGDGRAARRHAERALKIAPRGETAAEARKILQDAKQRR